MFNWDIYQPLNNVSTPKIRQSLELGPPTNPPFFAHNLGQADDSALRGNVFIAASVLLDLNLQGSS